MTDSTFYPWNGDDGGDTGTGGGTKTGLGPKKVPDIDDKAGRPDGKSTEETGRKGFV